MVSGKSKLFGAGGAIWIALALFLLAAIGFPIGIVYLSGSDMTAENKLTVAQLIVSILGFGGAIAAFIFALIQYRRTEQWRRIEFIAKEIKDFESDPIIQNALLMIDWGTRTINLFLVPNPSGKDYVKITRDMQWKALLPHPLKKRHPEYKAFIPSDEESESKDYHKKTFTVEEAKIRDTYDAFLTRLDRFANFIKAGLISSEELEPFISYWIDAMTKNEEPKEDNEDSKEDAAWRCALLTYINYYDYSGVKYLLECYEKDIAPNREIYSALKNSMGDETLAERLFQSIQDKQAPLRR